MTTFIEHILKLKHRHNPKQFSLLESIENVTSEMRTVYVYVIGDTQTLEVKPYKGEFIKIIRVTLYAKQMD